MMLQKSALFEIEVYLGAESDNEAAARLDQLRTEGLIRKWNWLNDRPAKPGHKLAEVEISPPQNELTVKLSLAAPDAVED
jgi:hypothetical protein